MQVFDIADFSALRPAALRIHAAMHSVNSRFSRREDRDREVLGGGLVCLLHQWIEIAGNVWAVIFAVYFVLLIVACGIDTFKGKSALVGLLTSVVALLQLLWVVPFILYVLVAYAPLLLALLAITVVGLTAMIAVAFLMEVIERRKRSRAGISG
jgi:hypothetical protein